MHLRDGFLIIHAGDNFRLRQFSATSSLAPSCAEYFRGPKWARGRIWLEKSPCDERVEAREHIHYGLHRRGLNWRRKWELLQVLGEDVHWARWWKGDEWRVLWEDSHKGACHAIRFSLFKRAVLISASMNWLISSLLFLTPFYHRTNIFLSCGAAGYSMIQLASSETSQHKVRAWHFFLAKLSLQALISLLKWTLFYNF